MTFGTLSSRSSPDSSAVAQARALARDFSRFPLLTRDGNILYRSVTALLENPSARLAPRVPLARFEDPRLRSLLGSGTPEQNTPGIVELGLLCLSRHGKDLHCAARLAPDEQPVPLFVLRNRHNRLFFEAAHPEGVPVDTMPSSATAQSRRPYELETLLQATQRIPTTTTRPSRRK